MPRRRRPLAAGFLVVTLLAVRPAPRLGRNLLWLELGGMALGFGLLAVRAESAYGYGLTGAELAPGMLLTGAGQGLVVSPLFAVVLAEV